MEPLTVIGIGADGWAGLGAAERELVGGADVLVAGSRHLGMVPDDVTAARVPWPSPLREGLPGLLAEHRGRRIVVLASGDPLRSGVGSTLVDLLGQDAVRIRPAVSSVALARARMGWSAETSEVVSLTTQPAAVVRRWLAPGARLVVLGADGSSARLVAEELCDAGAGEAVLDLWSNLGGDDEAHRRLHAGRVGEPLRASRIETPPLTVICITCPPDLVAWPTTPGLPDEAYEHDGQLTKRDLRASALARLAPQPGELLWDVGAGAGSVGIEWMRTHPRNRAIAVEADPSRAARISRNAQRLGVPQLEVLTGTAPEALSDLLPPDAVFVGGGVSVPGILKTSFEALRAGGRLVAHAVTLESETAISAAQAQHGGELSRISVETVESLGSMRGFRPARTITQWSVTR